MKPTAEAPLVKPDKTKINPQITEITKLSKTLKLFSKASRNLTSIRSFKVSPLERKFGNFSLGLFICCFFIKFSKRFLKTIKVKLILLSG
jgi:hypothetical protein